MTLDALEQRIGYVLKIGSILSTTLLGAGVVTLLAAPAAAAASILVHAGLLIVLATPIVRVLVSMVGFAEEREWKFVWMTIAVLGVLAVSVVAAFA
jgi:uncharacterized membrane protein